MYAFPPVPVKTTEPPSQKVNGPLFEIPATGTGKMFTGTLADVDEQPEAFTTVTE
jgi:hypothetical protein